MVTSNKRTEHAGMGVFGALLALLVSVPILFRGLYFEADLSVFGITAAAFAILTAYCRKENIKINFKTDITLCALTLFYVVSSFTAVNLGLALLELFKYVLLLVVYFTVKGIANEEGKAKGVLFAFAAVIALSSVISLLTAAGVLSYPGAYSAVEIERWLNGTVQYHNAFGMLAVSAFFISAGLFSKANVKSVWFYVSCAMAYFLMFGVIMSYSRGAWVVVPFVFAVYMIFADREGRISLFTSGIASLAAVMIVFGWFSAYVLDKNPLMCVLFLLAGMIISAVLGGAVHVILSAWSKTSHFKATAIAACAVIAAGACAAVFVPQITALLPQQLAQRLSGINFTSQTVTERFVFYRDAWDIAMRNPVTGSGGGAWKDLYGMYQSYGYSSSQAHSYIMQLFVESGVLGILAFAATIIMFYASAVRLFIKKKASRTVLCTAVSAATAIIVHSFIDFDLSIFAISVMLWCMFALISSLDTDARVLSVRPTALCAAGAAALIVWFMSCVSANAYNSGTRLFKEARYEEAYKQFDVASAFNPASSVYRSYKAASAVSYSKNAQLRADSVGDYEKAVRLAPYSRDTVQNGITLYSATGAYDIAVEYAYKTIEIQPKVLNNYLAYIQSAQDVVRHYMNNGVYDKALDIVTVAKDVDDLAAQNDIELTEAAKQVVSYFGIIYYNISGNPVD